MTRSTRILIAVGSLIVSLPTFFAVYAGFIFTYLFAVLGGYNGTVLQALVKLFSSWSGWVAMIPWLLITAYIVVFIYLLIRSSRGLRLPVFAQVYCLAIVILAIGVRIQLSLREAEVFFWFGVFSLPHVICLVAILYLNRRSTEPLAGAAQGSTSAVPS
jgi:hypothetical protein